MSSVDHKGEMLKKVSFGLHLWHFMVLSVFCSSAICIFTCFDLKNIHKTFSFYVKHMGLKKNYDSELLRIDFRTNYTFNWGGVQQHNKPQY